MKTYFIKEPLYKDRAGPGRASLTYLGEVIILSGRAQ